MLTSSAAKSPSGPGPVLPASVEESYRSKCKEIKKRITEIETSNDLLASRIQRARRAIQRFRLERAFLLEQLEKRTDARVDSSVGSPSPPPTVRIPKVSSTRGGEGAKS
jgi:non-histone protein 10